MKYRLLILLFAAIAVYSLSSPVTGATHAKKPRPAAAAAKPPTQEERVCVAASLATCMEGVKDKCDSAQGPLKSQCKKQFRQECEKKADAACIKK